MPVGETTLVDHLMAQNGRHIAQMLVVVPTFPLTAAYKARITRTTSCKVLIVESSKFQDYTLTRESQEVFCLIDPIRLPLEHVELAQAWRRHSLLRSAAHFVAVGTTSDAVTESLERDATGRIRQIRRSYGHVAPPKTANIATFASIVRASAMQSISIDSGAGLRSEMSRKGVLATDIPLVAEMVDLSAEAGFLRLNEWVLSRGWSNRNGNSRGDVPMRSRCDASVSVHSRARLIGPVVLQAGSVVEEDVTVIGPTVIGRHARLAAGSTVVQSLIDSSTQLRPGTNVVHKVVVGDWTGDNARGDSQPEERPAFSASSAGGVCPRPRLRWSGPPGSRGWAFAKRALDVLLAGFGLVVLSPVLLLVSIWIRLDSPGPAFFSHWRESVGGKEFPCIKFRTMVADAHVKQQELYANNEVDGPQFKLARDPRVTRLGNLLRRTNIDELPQLLNVILGHMSLIGPRPSPFRENQICVPWRRARLSVPPGLSGLWQICRDRSESADFHQWIYYDLLYVQYWSPWLDAKILAATVLTLGGRWRVPVRWLVPQLRSNGSLSGEARFGHLKGDAASPAPASSAA